jgi:predicted nucleic acid-binding Zn ribbon protein
MNRSVTHVQEQEQQHTSEEQRGQTRQQRAIARYQAHPKQCLFCGTQLPYEKRHSKFCNHTCSAKHNNRGVQRNFKGNTYCVVCGKPKKRANRYCDECIAQRVYNPKPSFESVRAPKTFRKLLIQERGHKCEDCQLETWKGQPIPLELHHVDGNPDNNSRENLQLLCPNCHAFTEHYKGAVKGKHSSRNLRRRKLYSEGRPH